MHHPLMFPPPPDPNLPREQNVSNLGVSPRPQASSSPNRPKLSLQTSLGPQSASQKPITALSFGVAVDSPTSRNTYTNAFKAQLSPAISRTQTGSASSSDSSPSSSSSTSPTVPYILPIGTRSILRNGPLPARHVSTTARTPKRLFRPVKRVVFGECLVELIPEPAIKDTDSSSESISSESNCSSSSSSSNGLEDVPPSTPVCRQRRKRREWVWTIGRTDEPGPSSPNGGQYLKNERWGLAEAPTLLEAPAPALAPTTVLQGQTTPESGPAERSTALPVPPSPVPPAQTSLPETPVAPALRRLRLEDSATPPQSPRPEQIRLPDTPSTPVLRMPLAPKARKAIGQSQIETQSEQPRSEMVPFPETPTTPLDRRQEGNA